MAQPNLSQVVPGLGAALKSGFSDAFKVGAFQGGGTRGVMQAAALAKLSPKFDLVAGTSVGSIVAGCVAAGVHPQAIIEFFTDLAPKIFSGDWWIPIHRLWRASKYPPDGLRAALTQVLGTRTLADCAVPFIATAFEMKTGRRAYFQSYGNVAVDADDDEIVIGPKSGMPLVDAMMASSAAQSYFPGHAWGGYLFWDGGSTGFNAPDMLALREAQLLANGGRIKMLSIGNGDTPWPYMNQDMTDPPIGSVLKATIGIAYSGPEEGMVWLAQQELGPDYHRLNPVIADYAIDDAGVAVLADMQRAALAALAKRPEIIMEFGG
ncbi:MAG: patatin-like phospholipase family protein [Patescibacteria group bacterium]|nr:patatin-like phospholipase family protein [Patescibacteria group bacterium]